MLTPVEAQQQEIEMVSIESLVPDDHLLRKIDRVVDFSFIRERVKHLYCADNGRPALDPVVLFKLLLLGGELMDAVQEERSAVGLTENWRAPERVSVDFFGGREEMGCEAGDEGTLGGGAGGVQG